jgi:hypothetical protein
LTAASGWRRWVARWVASSRGIGSAIEEARWRRKWRCSCLHAASSAPVARRVGLGLQASVSGVGEARPLGAVACRLHGCPPLSPVGLGEGGGSLVTAGRLRAPRAAVWLLLLGAGLHDMRGPAPAPQGRALERVGEGSTRDGWGCKQGELPLKGGRPLSKGDRVFSLPYAPRFSTFQAPGWGIPAVFLPRRWRDATPWELVPFSHRSASRIFIMQPGCIPPPAVTQDGDLQLDGGGKRAGLQPLLLSQPQGFSSLGLGRRVCRVGVGPCAGGGPLLHSVIGGKGGRRPWRRQCTVPGSRTRVASEPLAVPASATTAGRGSSAGADSQGRPRADLQLYGLLPVLASRVWAWAGASWQQHPP